MASTSSSQPKEVDILIAGFGAAGACAAYEAMESAERRGEKINILLTDRFEGGGATSRSGGIVYFGGGTDVQKKLGLNDDVENMYRYLKVETGDAVSDETLWRFCVTSAESAAWLRDSLKMHINVPDETALLCPFKTSNAPDKYSVFYSGSETAHPFSVEARAVPRGHKAVGPGNLVGTGNVLFAEMERAVLNAKDRGITVQTYTKVVELLWNDSKTRIVGAKLASMANAPFWVLGLYYSLIRYGGLTNPMPGLDPYVASMLQSLEARYSETSTVLAKRGVILCTGGFGRNHALVEQYVPKYLGCMPLGSASDDGHGIFELGIKQANARTLNMRNASAWKFIVPAGSMAKGLLVNKAGERIINEDVYGARLAEMSMLHNDGKGYLILDHKLHDECMHEVWNGEMLLFQKAFTILNLKWNRIKANTLEELVKATGATKLIETIKEYNQGVEKCADPKFGKQKHLLSTIEQGPFYAIIFDSHGTLWPTPYFTLGGLDVDELTGQVRNNDGQLIPGLFAAGRVASGVCSKSYVSGLSLADCVFSGRRAARYMVTGEVYGGQIPPVPEFKRRLPAKL